MGGGSRRASGTRMPRPAAFAMRDGDAPLEGAVRDRQRVVQRPESLTDGADGDRRLGEPPRRDRALAGERPRHHPLAGVVAADLEHVRHPEVSPCPLQPPGLAREATTRGCAEPNLM